MGFEDWYDKKVVKPKQDWARVSQEAKLKKLNNKKSKRDQIREEKILELGGDPIEVTYGIPLSEEERRERMEYEWDLRYPDRHKIKVKKEKIPKARGKDRSALQYQRDLLFGARSRAASKSLPFNLELEDLAIPDRCPVLGTKLTWGDVLTGANPTVDRVVPELGYVKGNIQVISHRANRLKNNMTLSEVKKIELYIRKQLALAEKLKGESKE